MLTHAIALIHVEDGVYGASFPDIPGCVTTASSLQEVLAKAELALALHLDGLAEDGLPLPVFRTADALQADPELAEDRMDAILAAVPVTARGRSLRVNITLDEALLTALDQAARAERQSRSAYLAEAARLRMAHTRAK